MKRNLYLGSIVKVLKLNSGKLRSSVEIRVHPNDRPIHNFFSQDPSVANVSLWFGILKINKSSPPIYSAKEEPRFKVLTWNFKKFICSILYCKLIWLIINKLFTVSRKGNLLYSLEITDQCIYRINLKVVRLCVAFKIYSIQVCTVRLLRGKTVEVLKLSTSFVFLRRISIFYFSCNTFFVCRNLPLRKSHVMSQNSLNFSI